jgi:tetratricopeptide (TPR) repeat protein
VKVLEQLESGIKLDVRETVTHEKDGTTRDDLMYEHIASIFDMSTLPAEERVILRNMALTPVEGIDTGLFGDWLELEDYNAFNSLVDNGWIILNRQADIAALHPIISDVAANKLTPDTENCAAYIGALLAYCRVENGDPRDWRDYGHILALASAAARRFENERNNTIGELYIRMAMLQSQLAKYDDSIKSLDRAQELLSGNDALLAEAFKTKGDSYKDIADFDNAITCYLSALDLLRGDDDELKRADIYNEIGAAYNNSAKYTSEESLQYHMLAAKIHERLHSPALARSYINIGVAHASGFKYAEAIEYKQKGLDLLESQSPSDIRWIAMAHSVLGDTLCSLGQYAEAMEHYQKSLETRLQIFSETHPITATAYADIATAYGAFGNYELALETYQKTLAVREQLLPKNHYKLAIAYNNVGKYLSLTGKPELGAAHHSLGLLKAA